MKLNCVVKREHAERYERRQSTKNKFEQNKPQKKRTLFSIPPKEKTSTFVDVLSKTTNDNTWRQKRTKQNNKCAKKEGKRREERWMKNKAYITTTPVKYYHKFCWQNAKNVDDDVVVFIIILIVVVVDVMAGASAGVVCMREWLCFSCCCFCLKKVNEPFRYDFTGEWLWKFFVSIIKFRYSLCCKLFWPQSYVEFFQMAPKVGADFITANSLIKVSHSLFFLIFHYNSYI